MQDQAQRLRELADHHRQRILAGAAWPGPRRMRALAVTSGKGGVGKTNLAVALGYALLELGHQVILFDADLGLANVDVVLGTVPPYHLGHLLRGEKAVAELIHAAPHGLQVIAGGSGAMEMVDLPEGRILACIEQLRQLEGMADFLILDTGAGLGHTVLDFVLAADTVVVVTTPEPTALADAYALVKCVVRNSAAADIRLIMNLVDERAEAELAMQRLLTAAGHFLQAAPEPLGYIPRDRRVSQAVKNQVPFLLGSPGTPAAQAVRVIARRLGGEPLQVPGFSLFFDRLGRLFSRKPGGSGAGGG